MSQELHYTSVPRGLKPGARGFCTVASTTGLSPTLAERLEGLSGYRAAFPPDHPQASLNPVAWSHVRISSVGQTLSVISRVGPAGLDYTDRPNKYAHHIVLESSERAPGGPAWVLEQPGFMATEWDGPPQQIASGRRPTPGDRPGGICRAWAERTGDAGWGGALAEAFLADSKRQVVVVFDPGVDVLPLFGEAIALLPADLRWEVTFQSYFTGLPPGITCLWRAVLRDTAEERQARGNPDSLIVDLAAAGRATGGSLVHWARTGESPVTLAPAPTVRTAVQAPKPEVIPPQPSSPRRVAPVVPEPASPDPYGLAPPPAPRTPRSSRTAPSPETRESARTSVWPMIAVSLLAFMLGGGFGGTIVYLLMQSRVPVATTPVVALSDTQPELLGAPVEPSTPILDGGKSEPAKVVVPKVDPEKTVQPKKEETKPTKRQASQGKSVSPPPSPAPKASRTEHGMPAQERSTSKSGQEQTRTDSRAKPPMEVANSEVAASLTPHSSGNSALIGGSRQARRNDARASTPGSLPGDLYDLSEFAIWSTGDKEDVPNTKVFAADVKRISLIGANNSASGGRDFTFSEKYKHEFEVKAKTKSNPQPIGKFKLSGKELSFSWERKLSVELKKAFQDCILSVSLNDNSTEYLLLRSLQTIKSPSPSIMNGNLTVAWTSDDWKELSIRVPRLYKLDLTPLGSNPIHFNPILADSLKSEDDRYEARVDTTNYSQILVSCIKTSNENKSHNDSSLLHASLKATVIIEVDGMKFRLVDVSTEPQK